MRLLRSLALGAALIGAGCAARLPEPQTPTMVRNFNGTLVAGYYVSPSAYQHYIQAQLYSNEGRNEDAAEELRLAIASDGASAYLRTRLAEELLALGRVDEAREEVEAALHLDGQFAEAHLDLARVRLRLGDVGGAEEALKRAIEIDRGCVDAYVALVGLYRERGLEARAEEVWQRLAKAVPSSAQAHEALGRMAAARDDDKAAEAAFVRALELDPSLQEARLELAQLLQAEGRTVEAIKLYREAYERSGDTKIAEMQVKLQMATGRDADARTLVERLEDEGGAAERCITVGWLHLAAKQPARARALAEEVLKSGDAGGRLLLGAALEAEGRLEDALVELRKITSLSVDFAAAQKKIAGILRDGGRYHDAIDALGRAIVQVGAAQGESAVDGLRDLLAQVHERAGNGREGIRLLESAMVKRPGSSSLAFALGAAYLRGGQWEKAVEVVKSVVLRRDPESAQALNFIGYALAERGVRLDEAKKLLERARALQPTSGEIADSLAMVLAKQGKLDEAERLLLRADRLAPDEPEILQHLGDLYVKKADRARAIDAYKRALQRRPEERIRRACEEQILLLETGRLGSR